MQVLDKAIDVLDALSEAPRTAAELAEATGEPRSTIYRLLKGLSLRGLVEETDRDGVFRLGVRLFELGSRVGQRYAALRENALPIMTALNHETGQTVFLVTRSGLRGVCVERIDGQQVQVMILPPGGSVALHGGSASRVLLAYAPSFVQDQFFAQEDIEQYTARTPDREALKAELESIRRDGYSVSTDDVVPGIGAIGAPVRGHTGDVIAAVSITGPEPSVLGSRMERNIELVLDAAARISRASGYRIA